MENSNIRVIKVSTQTQPKLLATSILLALTEGYVVKLSSIGDAIKVASKAIALANKFNSTGSELKFNPILEQITSDADSMTVMSFIISKEEDYDTTEVYEDNGITIVSVLNHKDLIASTLNKKFKEGSELISSVPIAHNGKTDYIQFIFKQKNIINV